MPGLAINQVRIRSKCKACCIYQFDPDLLEKINQMLAAGIARKKIIALCADYAAAHPELSAEEVDRLALTQNNLCRHSRHITAEIEAVRSLERTRGLIEDVSGEAGLSLGQASLRVTLGNLHQALLSKSSSEFAAMDPKVLSSQITQTARAAAQIEKSELEILKRQGEMDANDETLVLRGLAALRARLKPDLVKQIEEALQT